MVKHILILEDMELALNSISTILCKHYGYAVCVHSATSYYMAVEIANEHTIDVFVVDIELGAGKKNGIDFAERLRASKKYKDTRIIFTTADETAWRMCISQFHCYGYVTKPYKTKELLDLLDSLLRDSETEYLTTETLTYQEKNTVIRMDSKNFHLDNTVYRINLTATGKSALRIKLSNIIYLESSQRKTIIHNTNEKEELIETKFLPLTKFIEDMKNIYGEGSYFYQCKNCYIVNTNYCKHYNHEKQSLILAHNGKEFVIHVARGLRTEAMERFGKFE